MPAAVLSVGPMPEPVSRYQVPEAAFTSTPASFHNRSSALWVPLSSPREANGAAAAAIFARAAGASAMPLMPAGSACGPTMMKSLYMTSKRFTPKPSATNCSSDFLSCTNSTSASPFLARSMAWPVPLATTRTSMPVFFVNNGSRYSNSPESWVEVVDATTMKRSSASVGAAHSPTPRTAAPSPVRNIRLNMTSSLLPEWSASPQQFSLDEGRRLRRQGPRKELHRRPLFEQTAAMQEDDLIGKPPRLAEVVCGHDDLRAAQIDGGDDILDGARCRRVQIGRRLVEKEHLRRRRPGAGERQPLLFADGEGARRAMGEIGEAGVIEHFANPGAPQRPRDALEPEGVVDIGGRRAAQHDRVLEYHGLAPAIAGCTRSAPADGAGSRLQQPVAEAQQQALAGAVGSENDGARTAADRQRDAVDQPLADGLEGEVVELQRQDRSRAHRWPRVVSRRTKAAPLMISDSVIRMRPRPSASGRSPLLVSSAIVVVITRVTWSMLPPTIITAPTSAEARPKPASTAVTRLKRPSHSSVQMAPPGVAPSDRSCSLYSTHRSSTTWRASAATIGAISTVWATIIASGVNSRPSTPNGPLRDSSK